MPPPGSMPGKTRLRHGRHAQKKRARRQPGPKVPWGSRAGSPRRSRGHSMSPVISLRNILRAGCRVVPSIRATTVSFPVGCPFTQSLFVELQRPQAAGLGARLDLLVAIAVLREGPPCQNQSSGEITPLPEAAGRPRTGGEIIGPHTAHGGRINEACAARCAPVRRSECRGP